MLNALQTWAADHGYGQYPLPRSRSRRGRPDKIGLRLVLGTLGLWAAIILIGVLAIMGLVAYSVIRAAITG